MVTSSAESTSNCIIVPKVVGYSGVAKEYTFILQRRTRIYYLGSIECHAKWTALMVGTHGIHNCSMITWDFSLTHEAASDIGIQFICQEFADFLELNEVKHTFVPPYHPSSNDGQQSIQCESWSKRYKRARRGSKRRLLKHKITFCSSFSDRGTSNTIRTALETKTSHQI